MSCRDMSSLMSSFLDGMLEEAKHQRLQQHLDKCPDCKEKLELMNQIPQVLQTDKMLAPKAEFTSMVMQRIVISRTFQNGPAGKTTITTRFHHSTRYSTPEGANNNPNDLNNEARMLNLMPRETNLVTSARTPSLYLLRFSAVAAALVIMVSFSIYALQFNITPSSGTASTSQAMAYFVDTLSAGFQSPPELLVGLILAGLVLVGIWFILGSEISNPFSRRNKPPR